MKTAKAILVLAAALCLFFYPVSSKALTLDLTSDHCDGGCGPAGTTFGTVDLEQNGANVDVTVQLNSPYAFAKTGSADFQAFKFNATGVALGDITVDQTVPGQTLAADTGALNGDGTGNFAFGIACTTCGNGLSSGFSNDIVFHVADAAIADLTAPNNLGIIFVADVGNTTTGLTGPVDATDLPSTVPRVPEPGILILLGMGMSAVGVASRWIRKV